MKYTPKANQPTTATAPATLPSDIDASEISEAATMSGLGDLGAMADTAPAAAAGVEISSGIDAEQLAIVCDKLTAMPDAKIPRVGLVNVNTGSK